MKLCVVPRVFVPTFYHPFCSSPNTVVFIDMLCRSLHGQSGLCTASRPCCVYPSRELLIRALEAIPVDADVNSEYNFYLNVRNSPSNVVL